MLKKKTYFLSVFSVAILFSIAAFAYPDDAVPVYDADSYPPSFDNQGLQGNYSNLSSAETYTPPPEPPREQYISPAQRMARVEQQVKHLQQSQSSSKVEALQSEVQSLRGQVELLTRQLQVLQTQQKTFYSDLDKRIGKPEDSKPIKVADEATVQKANELQTLRTEIAQLRNQIQQQKINPLPNVKLKKPTLPAVLGPEINPPKTVVATKISDQPNVAEEQQIYQTAYDLIKSKKFNDAIVSLQKMLEKYPTGQFAANAHYWLGELYGIVGKHSQSATEFSIVVKNYPDSPKVSDAQLKLGLIYTAQFKWADAKQAFKKVINRYPGTASARLAAEQMKQIKEAGH